MFNDNNENYNNSVGNGDWKFQNTYVVGTEFTSFETFEQDLN